MLTTLQRAPEDGFAAVLLLASGGGLRTAMRVGNINSGSHKRLRHARVHYTIWLTCIPNLVLLHSRPRT
jgi:hypothetical protein